jgi:hypothetical protein
MIRDIPLVIYSHESYHVFLRMFFDSELALHPKKIVVTSSANGLPLAMNDTRLILYDDQLAYADRLYTALSSIDHEWIFWSHEIDIPVRVNWDFLDDAFSVLRTLKAVRLNLQVSRGGSSIFRKIRGQVESKFLNEAEEGVTYLREQIVDCSLLEVDPWIYRFNVNPAIMHLPTFLSFLKLARGIGFRSIETLEIEKFFLRYRILNLYTRSPLHCGYNCSAPEYKYFHITSLGKLTTPFSYAGNIYNEKGQAMDAVLGFYGDLLRQYKNEIALDFWPNSWRS